MCGIGGFYRGSVGETPTTFINNLWCSLEDRGTHAAGVVIGWADADKPISMKAAKQASICSEMLSKAKGHNTEYVLLHTRFTTQGSTKNNGNNHPVIGHGITLTHNGVLSNDTHIFNKLKINPLHDVDTEAINAALSVKSPKWMIENIQGSMSIAWVETDKSPDEVHLLTNGRNPLVIGRTMDNHVIWASTKTHLETSGFDFKDIFSAVPYKQYTISKGGRIKSKFISKNRTYPANNRQIHSSQFDDSFYRDFTQTHKKSKKTSKKASIPKKTVKPQDETEWVEVPSFLIGKLESIARDNGYQLAYDSFGNKKFVDTWEEWL